MGNLRIVTAPSGTNPNNGDLYLDDSGQLEWIGSDISDAEDYSRMVLQRIRCRLLLIRGEWYMDQRVGTPWREKVWVTGASLDVIRRIIEQVAEGTPGVDSVDSLELTLDATHRTMTIDLVATTDLGTVLTTADLDEPLIVEMPYGG
jgi:hypothetical protein